MIKAPPVIRRYLVKNYDLHNIPIGTNEVINNMQHLPANIGFFFAGNQLSINLLTHCLKLKVSLGFSFTSTSFSF